MSEDKSNIQQALELLSASAGLREAASRSESYTERALILVLLEIATQLSHIRDAMEKRHE